MDYNNITNFLDKFKKIIFEKEEINKIIVDIISKNISFKIDPSLIKIKNGIIYIKISPIVLNEVLIKKQLILKEILSILPNKNFKDIKQNLFYIKNYTNLSSIAYTICPNNTQYIFI